MEKTEFMTSRIHHLVSAFSARAKGVKERIAQPPTPSTTSSKAESQAPEPPPLNLRDQWLVPTYDDTEAEEKCCAPTVHPQSFVYLIWLSLVTFAFVYNVVVIPLRTSFPYEDEANIFSWLLADYMCDVVYLLDTALIRPRLRFVRDGLWVDDWRETRKNYVASVGFKLDLLSLMPADLLYLYFGLHTPILRLPRMLRILPFWELFDRLDMIVASPLIIRIGRTLSYMLYLIHLNACAYYIFSKVRGFGSTPFLYQGEGLAYVRCFYFAMKTATKIGKNPKPVNGTEETFMIFNWVIGVFACAAIIGQIRDIMTAAERSETEFRERLDRTVNLMERLNLPAHIQERVRMWFDYNKNMQKNFDEVSALENLPRKMQMDVAINVHIETLSKVQLFQDCDKALLRDLVLKLKPVLFLPGDLICKKGQVGKEMYIVKTGSLQVMGGPNGGIVLVTLSEGSVFGEISLLAVGGGNRRTADVRSKGFSNLFVLSKRDLNEALQDYPEAQKILQHKAKKLMKQNTKRETMAQKEARGAQIIGQKPPTPEFIRTVIKILPQNSQLNQLLSRNNSLASRSSSQERGVLERADSVDIPDPFDLCSDSFSILTEDDREQKSHEC